MHSSSTLVKTFKFDVFLCFRGEDTRHCFISHLHQALVDRKLRTFRDDQEIEKGSKISKELRDAIEKSRIFIIVLSEDFAASSFCLDEVVMILDEFGKGGGRWVLPVFYYVDPSHLAHTYNRAFAEHEKRFPAARIEKWTSVLQKLPDFFNVHLIGGENTSGYQYTQHIMEEVSRHVPSPIGLQDRIFKVRSLLSYTQDQVCVIGICGEAGMGKTMVAHGLYNCYTNRGFDHYRIDDNVEENLRNSGNVDQMMSILKEKKVFIIFEDIKHSKQLEDISEITKQLGSGSIVIITAQDKHLLDSYGIKNIYEVEIFSKEEALKLFSLKAFGATEISADFLDILNRVETYALGHPWTLEVIGSNLRGKSIEECESILCKYESITNRDIQNILEESFNALEKCQQDMLIHIALNLKELKLLDVEAELSKKYKVCPRINIRVLLDKSLLKIGQHGQVTLHTSVLAMIKAKV